MYPNLILAGAPKAGTSSLHFWLSEHPEVQGSQPKETYFAVDPGTHMHDPARHIANGIDGYGHFFPIAEKTTSSCKIVMEATPSYLYSETALNTLPDLPSMPRFVFVLREPAQQVYSLYTYFRDNWNWIPAGMSFAEFVEAARSEQGDFKGNELARHALRYADYRPFLEAWRNRVGEERMLVLPFDDLVADQRVFTQDLARWIGIDPSFFDSYGFPSDNETYAVKNRWLQDLNIRLRGYLPKGRTYEALRSLYRRVNTTKPSKPAESDAAIVAALRAEYAAPNAALAESFGLNLETWSARL